MGEKIRKRRKQVLYDWLQYNVENTALNLALRAKDTM